MLYDIVNPSDPYTMIAGSGLIAGIATLFLGEGKYGCNRINADTGEETQVLGLMLFSGPERVDEWIGEHSDYRDLGHVMSKCRERIAMALDTVLIGTPTDRALFLSATEKMSKKKRAAYAKEYHDKRRSSLNDIGKRAHSIAAALREHDALAKKRKT